MLTSQHIPEQLYTQTAVLFRKLSHPDVKSVHQAVMQVSVQVKMLQWVELRLETPLTFQKQVLL